MALQTFTAGQVLTAAQLTTLQANAYNQTVSNKVASYVLVAADRGTRVVMNNAGATTITVNSGLFTAGDTLFIQNIGAGTCTITAGTCTVNTSGSLALAQWGGGTLYFTSASAAIFFPSGGIGYGTATGGTSSNITVSGTAYRMLTFTSTATLTVTRAGLFDVMLVAGGGAGNGGGQSSGGGGAGIITSTIYLPATTYTATVAAGGASAAVGSPSYLGVTTVGSQVAPTAIGGGSYTQRGANGYGQIADFTTTVSALFQGQGGFSGGAGQGTNTNGGGGGGGGSANGGNGTASVGGAGGAGFDASAWRGESAATTRYAGGGGGGIAGTGTGGTGGVGGGGNGVQGATVANPGTANTGGGGGGAGSAATGGNGGSGIILVRFKV
jgi:hypothetical protein